MKITKTISLFSELERDGFQTGEKQSNKQQDVGEDNRRCCSRRQLAQVRGGASSSAVTLTCVHEQYAVVLTNFAVTVGCTCGRSKRKRNRVCTNVYGCVCLCVCVVDSLFMASLTPLQSEKVGCR